MKIFKKAAALVMGFLAAFTCLFAASCSSDDDGKTTIVCTIFPQYDWVMQILGGNPSDIEVVLLLDDGTELHSYSPSAEDIRTLKYAELFIYVGGESDESWVDDAASSSKTNALMVALMEEVDPVEETEEGVYDEQDVEEGEDETEYDEHVWLSLKNARTLVGIIADKICGIDPENAATYSQNAAAYAAELDNLDGEYAAAVQSSSKNPLLFADRFPFKYLVQDYGLEYFAALKGCSSQESVSLETIRYLAQKIIDLNLQYVIVIESTDASQSNSTARQVISWVAQLDDDNSGIDIDILVLNSCQQITAADIAAGASYLDIMTENLETLKKALG